MNVSATDGLANVVAGLGTERDKGSYTHYALSQALPSSELEAMYRSSWLSKRIVNVVADDMTREWRQHVFDSEKATEQLAVENTEKRLQVKAKVNEAIRWARLYGGAGIIIGIKGVPMEQLEQPLDPSTVKKDSLAWLHVADRFRLTGTGALVDDLASPAFGTPAIYTLSNTATSLRIHHTRVIRFDGQLIPWNMFIANGSWGDSILNHVYTSVKNSDAAAAQIATMMFEANIDVIKVQELNSMLAMECGESQVIKRFQLASLMKSINRTLVLDAGEEYDKKSNNFANLDKIWEKFMVDVCGAADIPMVRLFGQSAGGLNATGDSDIRNYYDMISAQQEAELRPQLEYLDETILRSALGRVPSDHKWDFRSLWQMSDTEVAQNSKTRADRDAIYLDRGVLTEGAVARELKENGTYTTLTDEDVAMAEELAESMNEEADEAGEAAITPKQDDKDKEE